jgi:hypothetical protein
VTERKAAKPELEGFGVHKSAGEFILPHHFRVDLPAAATAPVVITEDYGLSGGEGGVPYEEVRVVLPRAVWTGISAVAKRDFNVRLKAQKLPAGQWKVGTGDDAVKVERLLGKELCVLAWAAEPATSKDALSVISQKWTSLRPEERWWLFAMTVAEAGRADDSHRGWRRALNAALSDPGDDFDGRESRGRPFLEGHSSLLPQLKLLLEY